MTTPALIFRIGGHNLRITGAEAIALLCRSEDFGTFLNPAANAAETGFAGTTTAHPPHTGAAPLFTFQTGCDIPEADGETLYEFSFDDILCRFGHAKPADTPIFPGLQACQETPGAPDSQNGRTFPDAGTPGYFLTMTPPQGTPFTLRFQPGDPVIKTTAPGNATLLRFGLWTAYGLAGAFRSAIPVHSSAIVWQGRAVLFLGESGTGKSTHTQLWQQYIPGATLLNDDSPILRIREGNPYIYGSPWSGKTPCFRNEHYPLAAVVRLSQAPHNRMTPLPTLQAFGALLPSCPPAFAHDALLSDHVCDILSDTLRHIKSYRLECLPDRAAAETAFGAIFSTDKTTTK